MPNSNHPPPPPPPPALSLQPPSQDAPTLDRPSSDPSSADQSHRATASFDPSNSSSIPPCFSTLKLLSESHDHQNHSELWPHQIWDLELNSSSAIWNRIIHQNQRPPSSPSSESSPPPPSASSPPASHSPHPPPSSKYPPISIQELILSKPHPNSFFCPIEWRWLTIEVLDQFTPPRPLDPQCSQDPASPSSLHHFFQLIKSCVNHVHSFNPTPTSIFDQHPSQPSSPSPPPPPPPPSQQQRQNQQNQQHQHQPSSSSSSSSSNIDPNFEHHDRIDYDPSIRWDARICVGCKRGIFHSPIEATVPSIFNRQDALDLIAHARKYNHLPTHIQTHTRPEQLVYKAWHTVYIVAQNALIEQKLSPLPLNGKSISGRMPWDSVSAKIWASLGVVRKDETTATAVQGSMTSKPGTQQSPSSSKNSSKHTTVGSNKALNTSNPLLVLPSLNVKTPDGRKNRAKWCRALLEISVFLKWYKLQHPHVEESAKSNYIIPFNLVPASPKIAQMLGGISIPTFPIKTTWQTPSGRPVAYQAYSTLGIIPTVPDEIIILAYQVQVKTFPNLRYEFFEALREIKSVRDSESLDVFLGMECSCGVVGVAEAREAWALITVRPNGELEPMDLSREEFIMNSFNLKNDAAGNNPSEKVKLREALRTLVEANPMNVLLRVILDSASTAAEEKSNNSMDLNKAYATLGDVVPEVDDEILWMAYTIGVSDQPSQKEVLRQALQVIAHHRKSQLIQSRLMNELTAGGGSTNSMEIVPYSPPPVSYDLPAGLNNIGNTCYLNSLLQYFFSVRELREILLRFPEFEQDVNEHDTKEKKRVGGRIVSTAEIIRSKQFASQLQGLFREMITTPLSAVTPERELAFLALVLSKDESPSNIPTNNNHNSSASTDATLVDDQSGALGPTYNPTPSPPAITSSTISSTVLGKRKSESIGSDDEAHSNSNTKNQMEVDSTTTMMMNEDKEEVLVPEEEDLIMNASTPAVISEAEPPKTTPLVIDLTDETNGPPPLPPRPNRSRSIAAIDSGSHMMFGRQNDVSECMDNCLFQIQAALDQQKVLASGNFGNEGNLVKSLFYGKTRQSLMFENPKGKVSVKEEPFAYLLVDVAEEGRDLYDGLDRVFDESEVELENGKACRRVGLVELPPILQIQLQRVQFDRRTHTIFKSNAHLKFEERLRMDRYLEPDPDDELAQEKRTKTISLRKEIESLRGRLTELTTNLTGDKRNASTILRDLHKILSSPMDNNSFDNRVGSSRMEFFDGLIGPSELEYLESEAISIDREIEDNKFKVDKLKAEVEEMWKVDDDDDDENLRRESSSNSFTLSGGGDSNEMIVEDKEIREGKSSQLQTKEGQSKIVSDQQDGYKKNENLKEHVTSFGTENEKGSKKDVEKVNEGGDINQKVNNSQRRNHNRRAEYKLVSLFMHRGTAQGGHYWAVQRQLPDRPNRWLKYNDSQVSEIEDERIEVFNNYHQHQQLRFGNSFHSPEEELNERQQPKNYSHHQFQPTQFSINNNSNHPHSNPTPTPHTPHTTPRSSSRHKSQLNHTNNNNNANPYWLTYVRIGHENRFQMLKRIPPSSSTSSPSSSSSSSFHS